MLRWEHKLKVCRGYAFSIDEVLEMDFLAYLIALKDLADTPSVDESLLLMFGGKKKGPMSIADRRAALKRKSR